MEGPSPVLAITADDIANSGAQNISQLLSKLSVAGQGTFSTQGNDADDTSNGGSAISLRGLGADSTLVLLNGRRISVSAFAKNIGTAFVDINSIPVSAIARIDILKDGASATYGSDAVAGVVNFITRTDFDGLEVSASYSDRTASASQANWDVSAERYGHTCHVFCCDIEIPQCRKAPQGRGGIGIITWNESDIERCAWKRIPFFSSAPGYGTGRGRAAVETMLNSQHFVAAGLLERDAQCILIGLSSAVDQKNLVKQLLLGNSL